MKSQLDKKPQPIAVVGMALRVPGANNLEKFWQNILDGRDCLTRSSIDELFQAGVSRRTLADPQSVLAMPKLDDIDYFDASFFNMAASEAERTEPVHRLFLECAFEGLEHAGIVAGYHGPVTGVFGGVEGCYLRSNLDHLLEDDPVIQLPLSIGNDIDFFTTRVSNKLDMNGPSFAVMAACATSLLAIHLGVKSIQQGECEVAVAGGGTLLLPQQGGYLAGVDGMLSASGRIRTFDAAADGTVFGSGVGAVVLRSLESALDEGNPIYAVIKGSASSNDGNPPGKQSFIAPSPAGQMLAIGNALANAETGAETIGLIEAHGTGTLLGDPVEVTSLTEVYRQYTDKKGYCALGSVKANVGHLRAAAGVVSLIKTCLAINHGILPKAANFDTPNPKINFKDSPFYINTESREWLQPPHLRRAGVSAFGFGGSNAHVVLEGFEQPAADQSSRDNHLFVISAKSDKALARRLTDLHEYIEDNPDQLPADIAYTLQCGRQAMSHRTCFYVNDASFNAAAVLPSKSHISGIVESNHRPLVFLFPGQGSQWPGMGQGLYASEPVYRETVDYCAGLLESELGFDLRTLIHTKEDKVAPESAAALKQTVNAQPALFVVEYAAATLFQSWGVKPDAMLGHSVGELVAACIAGVFSLDDALKIVAARSRLMQHCEPGSMVAVLMPENELREILPDKVEIATINAPNLIVVSGPSDNIEQFAIDLADKGISSQSLKTSHAFHSWMMEPALGEFKELMHDIQLQPPRIQVLSNVTGNPLTESQATDANYWAEHIRRTVHFSKGLEYLLAKDTPVFIELGPRRTLTELVLRQSEGDVFASMMSNPSSEYVDEQKDALETLGKLWCAGVDVKWQNFYGSENRRKINLPTYPFQRHRHWIDPEENGSGTEYPLNIYEPGWVEVPLEIDQSSGQQNVWLVFCDQLGLAQAVIRQLEDGGDKTVSLVPGNTFTKINEQQFAIRPGNKDDLTSVLAEMTVNHGAQTMRVLHFWSFTGNEQENETAEAFKTACLFGFHTLLALVQAAYEFEISNQLKVLIVANGLAQLDNEDHLLHAEKAVLLGPCRVIPQEISGLAMRCIDIPANYLDITDPKLPPTIIAEAMANNNEVLTALRLNGRYVEKMFNLPALPKGRARLRQGGAVLITGGVGGLGLLTAKHLFDTVRARLILCSRWLPPPRDQWATVARRNDKIGRALKELIELEASGAEVLIVKTDVTDFDSLSAAVSQARAHFGGIDGVVHAAGTINDGPALGKTQEAADRVFGAKVIGAFNLEKIFADSVLDIFIYFSSMSSYYPPVGQVDYSAANAVLDRLALRRAKERPGLCCAMGWGAWINIGMGLSYGNIKPTLPSLFEQITDESPERPEEEVGHVLLSTRQLYPENKCIYRGVLQQDKHWVAREHLLRGAPLISGTTIIEMVRASFVDHTNSNETVELQKISFLNPLFVDAEGTEFEILFVPENDDERFELHSRVFESSGEWTVNVMGYASVIQDGPVNPDVHIPDKLLSYIRDQDSIIERGSHFVCKEDSLHVGESSYARVRLVDEFHDELSDYGLHPSLFDRAIHVIMEVLFSHNHVPYTFNSIRHYGKLGGELIVHAQQSSSGDTQAYDLQIGDTDGKTLVEITDYVMRRYKDTDRDLSSDDEVDSTKTSLKNSSSPQRIVFNQPGDLESLRFQKFTPSPPQKGEVQIEVKAAGLNFRDVLAVLGQLPEEAETRTRIGSECSGIITAVGKGIEHLHVGDRVLAMSNNSFATHVTEPAHSVTHLAGNISFTDGAGIPITFLTADYALNKLARLQKGERILIHAATGGVGLAAVQLAQKVGAEIFATAGHDEKRQYLQEIGVEYIMDSRSLDFVEAVMEYSNGEGVDVVLNSLGGEFIPASLKLLKPFGRFLEVGKRDIHADMQLGLYPFRNNLSYYAVELGQLNTSNQLLFEELFEDLMKRFACGKLDPSPTAVMPINEISKGFSRMAKAEHIGKIVFSMIDDSDQLPENRKQSMKKYSHGIEIEKGLEVFNRLISSDETPPYILAMGTSIKGIQKTKSPLSVVGGSQLQRKVDTPFCEPTCAEEATLVKIWEKTLGITPIGIDDNFFELGGDSINAILIQFEISKGFNVKLPTTVLFDYPIIKDLAALIRQQASS